MLHTLNTHQVVPATLDEVWTFFSNPQNLNLLTPPSLHFRVHKEGAAPIYAGQIIRYTIRILPLVRVEWVTEIKEVTPLASFIDEQRLGPYRFWHHLHRFREVEGGVEVSDTVHYEVGFGPLGDLLHTLWIEKELETIFAYRQKVMKELFLSPPTAS
ncbi:MAG: hypothetical protein C0621_02090 [Desulfuromonas sp.]|nr:MAG: hypothetical protein C0621_02090 [Desulfuromonas sp.]